MKILLMLSLLSDFQLLFSTQGFGELRKFGGTLKRRSAMGKISMESDIFQWGRIRLVIYGFENIWMGRDVGPIQLDPQEADYLLGGGFKTISNDKWYAIFLDHTCYHKIDTFVDRSLYWNKLKFVFSNRNLNLKTEPRFFYYRLEIGSYLRHEKIPWLTVGNPNQFDLLFNLFYVYPVSNTVMPFLDVSFYSGLTLDYNLTPEIEVNSGLLLSGISNEGMIYLGFRPIDRKGYREAEGVIYLGLKVKF
ncbi:MAG: hypothetical protein QMD82_04500 [bacterium]|nr:hypothetical protein [bacterium]